ncbi:signal recognition particle-docking protein FtsY [Candidatus Synechococcus calcipolaris G9]|uniref:Signal recognition particle receptor FtsY n=1 Tax=Candidatus Synechococcus calcipolaris G9 TaxID=1497997 RepID=A0ABT6F0K5_9SYNE|nr:signal recognition particle-docking protein FtsY [Candidatus Synechococcus calcipolaris]MDG2991390.1 signal recognition particle-docking protein FtsY [Candidatus Synechococcus calcipolaris G9]
MVFNWFRRKFGKDTSEDEEQTSPTPEIITSEVESPSSSQEDIADGDVPDDAEPVPESTEPNPPKRDILAWARTAYQSIQSRQTDTLPTDSAETPSPERTEPTASPLPEPQPFSGFESPTSPPGSKADSPSMTPAALEPVVNPPSQPAVLPTDEAPIELPPQSVEPSTLEPLPEAVPTEPEVLSEPAPPPPQALEASIQSGDESALELDEGFLWSAEVLAAQGRRPEEVDIEEINWLQRLRQGLGKTRRGLVNQLKAIVGQGPLSNEAVEEIEMLLLQSDVGVKATDYIIEALQAKIRQETLPPDAAIAYLKEILLGILDAPFKNGYSPNFAPKKQELNVWLMTGVNGVGKTTTIGKIAHVSTQSGYRCLVAAADTFRAAAAEQVKIWAERSQVEVIANPGKNTDPAAVVFDAIIAAQARDAELLLVDTAGRLQNKKNLMEELKKIRRIIDKKAPNAAIESLLVLDATLGQNGLRQAQVFAEAAQLTGVIITKLDGTAKGGVALAVVQELGLPIRFIGAGEGISDLRPFSSYEFVEALLSQ